jgi:hypothetical protein
MSYTPVLDKAVVEMEASAAVPPMKIVNERPPVWNDVCKMIGATPQNAIFAWGDIIYNPDAIVVPDFLISHEEVHQLQQRAYGGPEKWWSRYLDDVFFRLKQETEAYAVQYVVMSNIYRDRNQRFQIKVDLARKLAGPLYGNSLKNSAALAMLDAEIKRIS